MEFAPVAVREVSGVGIATGACDVEGGRVGPSHVDSGFRNRFEGGEATEEDAVPVVFEDELGGGAVVRVAVVEEGWEPVPCSLISYSQHSEPHSLSSAGRQRCFVLSGISGLAEPVPDCLRAMPATKEVTDPDVERPRRN